MTRRFNERMIRGLIASLNGLKDGFKGDGYFTIEETSRSWFIHALPCYLSVLFSLLYGRCQDVCLYLEHRDGELVIQILFLSE